MSGRRRNNDRRSHSRFEVVGDLSGTLELVRSLPIIDISMRGALVESDRELQIGSVHSVLLANGIEVGHAQMCVKHIRRAAGAMRFLVGVEFLALSPALTDEISRWLTAGNSTAGSGGAE